MVWNPWWLQDDWAIGKTVTAVDPGHPSKDADQTDRDTDLLHGSSGSSSLDGEIASAGFGRPAVDDLGDGSPQGASLVQGEWSYSPTKLGPSDFELLRVVGQGAFGKVCALQALLHCPCVSCLLVGPRAMLASVGLKPGVGSSTGVCCEA